LIHLAIKYCIVLCSFYREGEKKKKKLCSTQGSNFVSVVMLVGRTETI
jgi:hypothetical protein